jgi:hypothetical protein
MMMDTKAVPCAESKSEIYIHARQTKLLIWAELNRGGCAQSNGQLALRSDGTGTWSCMTTSHNASGSDVWHADFAVKDRNGVTLFGLGPFYSPRMDGGASAQEYRWSATFSYSAEMFPSIHAALQNCGCLPPAHALRQARRPEVEVEDNWCRVQMASAMGGAYA